MKPSDATALALVSLVSIMITTILFSGCATSTPASSANANIINNDPCANGAEIQRMIAVARDQGVDEVQVERSVLTPTLSETGRQTMIAVVDAIYSSPNESPQTIEANWLTACHAKSPPQ